MTTSPFPTDPRIVLISDPRVGAVPVRECGEPLVDCRGRLRVDARRADPAGHFAYLRAGVAERLERAEKSLPNSWRWLLIEGYRPPALQQQIFDGYATTLRKLDPGADEERIRTAASRWCAPAETAGHVAGAAIDLTVCTRDGAEIDMGSPEAATPEESGGACYTHAPGLSERARENRAIMIKALSSAGMVNYPTEWWHWSYGDRYWAWSTAAPAAAYGPVPEPHTDPHACSPEAGEQ
ncbi:dipeptidase [Streptomyces malaysiensis subsp. malaysiensis]|uniref:M15 family metallopeptidase n=1 Tax=Streptomyces malaysiensis TaxID=92644 RepID=UPI000BFDC9C2|nr:M15 family metallopeptidase [Streptomyces malaysiensis]ATL85291.1 putative cell-wall-binding dipeptidase [Streptomyces malaysiensis]QDL70946.1 dipeptidase [Streptomyces malaysiensis]